MRNSRTSKHDYISSMTVPSINRSSPVRIHKHHKLIVGFRKWIIGIIRAIGDLQIQRSNDVLDNLPAGRETYSLGLGSSSREIVEKQKT